MNSFPDFPLFIRRSLINLQRSMEKSTKKYRILLVEDEKHLRDALKLNLDMEGYDTVDVGNGGEAIEKFRHNRFDLAILDVMLPGVDGFTVCQTVRLEGNDTPILFLTAKNTTRDRVEGLKIGGDDYLAKPFDLEELLLRVQKLIRRRPEGPDLSQVDEISFGNNHINFKSFEIRGKDGLSVQISKKEIMLLKLLTKNDGQVVSREEILETVWGYDVFPSTRTIDNYILAFRKYFEEDSRTPKFFHSVRGVGYKFTREKN
jgi:two-component system, OmpR family, alkaline phosphatase synthesis response regulator PhoP